jgi:hypothetical protein
LVVSTPCPCLFSALETVSFGLQVCPRGVGVLFKDHMSYLLRVFECLEMC